MICKLEDGGRTADRFVSSSISETALFDTAVRKLLRLNMHIQMLNHSTGGQLV